MVAFSILVILLIVNLAFCIYIACGVVRILKTLMQLALPKKVKR